MSGSSMLVGQIASQVAGYVQKCYPADKEDIFSLLTLVQDTIWKLGKFHNSTAYFHVNVHRDGTIVTPNSYNVLLGININSKPVPIKDQSFLFHQNGPGSSMVDKVCSGLYQNAYDLGESPVLFQPTDKNCRCGSCGDVPRNIKVKTPSEGYVSNQQYSIVSGLDHKGNNIYTYETQDSEGQIETCLCTESQDEEDYSVIEGVRYPIFHEGVTRCNVPFTRINNIIKTPTPVPVEYYVVGKEGCETLIARMEPNQIVSKYRRYQLDTRCRNLSCVLGLFKRSEPDPVTYENQVFISRNMQAIISLCIAMDFKYNKTNPGAAVPYLNDALAQLNAELKENKSNTTRNIQVDSSSSWANFPKM